MKMEQPIDPLFKAEEIIERGFVPNEATLVSLVLNKQLIAYDQGGNNPIDLDSKKQIFTDIQNLCKPVTKENVVIQAARYNPYEKKTTPERRGSRTYHRVKSTGRDGEWILPWPALKKILSEDIPEGNWPIITIPESQYLAIKAGWNADRDSELIHDSYFKKSELDALHINEGNSTGTKLEQILDSNHPWHSEPLAIAVRAWMELYSTRDGNKYDNTFKPIGGNTNLINKWLTKNMSERIGPTTTGHYCFIINPGKGKGPPKTQDE